MKSTSIKRPFRSCRKVSLLPAIIMPNSEQFFFRSPSNYLSPTAALRIERAWHPCRQSHLKASQRTIGQPFSHSQVFSQIFSLKQRTFLFIVSCLFLFSLEITGEPQDYQGRTITTLSKEPFSHSSPSQHSHAEYFHQSVIVSDRTENIDHDKSVDMVDSDDITIFQQHLTTIAPHLIGNAIFHGNQSRDLSSESPASVIASSFRNVDNAQSQSTAGDNETSGLSLNQQSRGQTRKSYRKSCDTTVLKRCLDGLPPMNDTGIPSTPQAVNTACRIYDSGINCFDNWAKNCLHENHRQKVKASITGAHEMFSFLCKDPKFRSDYLKHKDCYRKLSPHWDTCSKQFIDGLRKNTGHNKTAFCCIRLDFLRCVSTYSSISCSRDATKFLMKMAETLVRSSIRTRSRIPEYCINIHQKHCVSITENAAPLMSSSHLLAVYVPATCFLSVSSTFLMQRRL